MGKEKSGQCNMERMPNPECCIQDIKSSKVMDPCVKVTNLSVIQREDVCD